MTSRRNTRSMAHVLTPSTRKSGKTNGVCVACVPSKNVTKRNILRSRSATPSKKEEIPNVTGTQSCVACSTVCTSCTHPLLTKTDTKAPAQWLQDLERPAVPIHSRRWQFLERNGFKRVTSAPRADIVVTYTACAGHRLPDRVVYWASAGCSLHDAHNLRGAERAYGEYTNMGIAARTTFRGRDRLTFRLASPCAYIARTRGQTKSQQWCRHLHFVPLKPHTDTNSPTATWYMDPKNQNELFTLPVFPCTLLNSYTDSYTCEPVHHSHQKHRNTPSSSMFVERADFKQSTNPEHGGHAVGVCAINDAGYPPINEHDIVLDWKLTETQIAGKLSRTKNITKHTPLVVYCANETCEAAQHLIEKMAHVGYCNVWYFKAGMGVVAGRTKKKINHQSSHHFNHSFLIQQQQQTMKK